MFPLFPSFRCQGIKFLVENSVIADNSPEAIADFLHSHFGLDKTVLGDYLGEGDPLNLKVLFAYVDYMDFTGLTFENALRFFLEGFRLPGEAQKIDRIMETFGEKFCRCNPRVFASSDVAYVLAYAVIMLNTDAHSSQVKHKVRTVSVARMRFALCCGCARCHECTLTFA